MKKRPPLWKILYMLALLLFSVYVLADTFLIPRTYGSGTSNMNLSLFSAKEVEAVSDRTEEAEKTEVTTVAVTGKTESSSVETTGAEAEQVVSTVIPADAVAIGTFKDDKMMITVYEIRRENTSVYVADVQVSSAQLVKTAFANDSYGKNVTATTSSIASSVNAVLAVNGDYYGARESGYVIRNGVLYRSVGNADTDVLCIYADGSMKITNSSEKTAEELLNEGVWQAFSFGPALLENGNISVSQGDEVGQAMASNPRTAIGIVSELHYLFVVSDGRTSESAGLSLQQLAQVLQELGCTTAYNLDGGGSSTMVFQGTVINHPTTSGRSIKERSVSDIVYIGS